MAIRLLRESSETPNITNKDDVRMIRYAYGGYNGVVQKYGEELAGSASGGTFRIGSGRVVLHGWEVEIDGAGWTLDLSSMSSGAYYYTVYLEVNAELETVEIKYLYDTAQHPAIDPGDDLTSTSNGISRLSLYHLTVSYGSVSNTSPLFQLIPFVFEQIDNLSEEMSEVITKEIDSIKDRLDALGFREGVVSVPSGATLYRNSLKKQGKYVLMDLMLDYYVNGNYWNFTLPEGFRPKEDLTVRVAVQADSPYGTGLVLVSIGSNGTCRVPTPAYGVNSSYFLDHLGWETN